MRINTDSTNSGTATFEITEDGIALRVFSKEIVSPYFFNDDYGLREIQ